MFKFFTLLAGAAAVIAAGSIGYYLIVPMLTSGGAYMVRTADYQATMAVLYGLSLATGVIALCTKRWLRALLMVLPTMLVIVSVVMIDNADILLDLYVAGLGLQTAALWCTPVGASIGMLLWAREFFKMSFTAAAVRG